MIVTGRFMSPAPTPPFHGSCTVQLAFSSTKLTPGYLDAGTYTVFGLLMGKPTIASSS